MMLTSRNAGSWQLILADLALILFLVAMTAAAQDAEDASEADTPDLPAPVPVQALYRPGSDAPEIRQWIEQQSPDPRMTLSIVATHRSGEAQEAWESAQTLAQSVRQAGVKAKVIVREGEKPDLFASLGFDDPQ